jgi:hypothetical protein
MIRTPSVARGRARLDLASPETTPRRASRILVRVDQGRPLVHGLETAGPLARGALGVCGCNSKRPPSARCRLTRRTLLLGLYPDERGACGAQLSLPVFERRREQRRVCLCGAGQRPCDDRRTDEHAPRGVTRPHPGVVATRIRRHWTNSLLRLSTVRAWPAHRTRVRRSCCTDMDLPGQAVGVAERPRNIGAPRPAVFVGWTPHALARIPESAQRDTAPEPVRA